MGRKRADLPKPGGVYDEVVSRQRGYLINYKSPKVRLKSGSEIRYAMTAVELGNQRAGLLAALGQRLVAFFDQLGENDFERAANIFLKAAGSHNTPRTRCNAVRSALQVLYKSAELMQRAARARCTDVLADLQAKMDVYFRVLSADNFAVLGNSLAQMLRARPRVDYTDYNGHIELHIAKTFMTMVTDAMEALVLARQMGKETVANSVNPASLEQAERELRAIEAEIIGSRRRSADHAVEEGPLEGCDRGEYRGVAAGGLSGETGGGDCLPDGADGAQAEKPVPALMPPPGVEVSPGATY